VSQDLREQLQATLGDAYLLEHELGGGGMSRVFVAHETSLGRQVVVKVLLPELAAGVSVDRFRREIQLAARLQHPHIVPLLSAGESNGLPFFTMPFVVGESLRARVARGELPIGEAVHILRDVVSAVAYAHDFGVVHRDIKPDNVLLSGGVAVVTDFGVAKAVSASTDAAQHTSLTSMGVALGTPAYMAPEQATADPNVDHRADIYALGAMAYEMLTGRPPFAGRTAQATLAAHVIEEPDPIDRRRPGLPPALSAMVMQCLAKRPADRPQSAAELKHTLDALGTPSQGTAPTQAALAAAPAAAESRAPVRRSQLLPLVTAGLAAALLLMLGAFWARRPGAAVGGADAAGPPAMSAPAEPATPVTGTTPEPAPEAGERGSARAPAVSAPSTVRDTRHPGPQIERVPFTPPTRADAAASASPSPAAAAPNAMPDTPATPVREAVPAVAPAVAPPVAAPPTDPRPEIRGSLADYAAAIESESVGSIRRVYPAMSAEQQRGWEQFFGMVREVKATLSLGQLDLQGSSAEAQVVGSYAYLNTSTHRTEQRPVSFHMTFRRDSSGWRIAEVR
jgi:serine/threonine-protein kinase